jgi:hypothetical protein
MGDVIKTSWSLHRGLFVIWDGDGALGPAHKNISWGIMAGNVYLVKRVFGWVRLDLGANFLRGGLHSQTGRKTETRKAEIDENARKKNSDGADPKPIS